MTNALTHVTHALLRIVAGLLFFSHGAVKLFGWFGGMPAGSTLSLLTRTAGWIEVVAGALVMAGLFTRPVAFIASGEMAVAYFLRHQPQGFWPLQNRGELAALYCFIFLFLSTAGAGPLSLDALRARPRRAED